MTYCYQNQCEEPCYSPCNYGTVCKYQSYDCRRPCGYWGYGYRNCYPYSSCYTRKYSYGSCYPCYPCYPW